MKEQIRKLCEDFTVSDEAGQKLYDELLILYSVSGSAYQEKLLKKADDMKETGKIWHTNKVYTDGIDCALDNMKEHIKRIGNEHYC